MYLFESRTNTLVSASSSASRSGPGEMSAAAFSALSFLPVVLNHAVGNIWAARTAVAPWVIFFFVVQAICEALPLPAAIVKALAPRSASSPAAATRAASRDFRTKVLATGMAIYVVIAAARGFSDAPTAALRDLPYESTAISAHLCAFACAFFLWDIVACIRDGEAAAYHAHAWGCALVFALALAPFQQYMALHGESNAVGMACGSRVKARRA